MKQNHCIVRATVLLAVLSFFVLAPAAALAGPASGSGSAAAVKASAGGTGGYEDFNPSGKEEQVNAPLFVTIAYSVIWIVPLVYLIGLWRRQARLRDEVAAMRSELGLDDADSAPKR